MLLLRYDYGYVAKRQRRRISMNLVKDTPSFFSKKQLAGKLTVSFDPSPSSGLESRLHNSVYKHSKNNGVHVTPNIWHTTQFGVTCTPLAWCANF